MTRQDIAGVDSAMTDSPVIDPPRRAPVRTCGGCRGHDSRSDLLRIVVREGACVPDPAATWPGRGAWLHPDQACLDLAVRRRALPRAFKVVGPLDTRLLGEHIARDPARPTDQPSEGPTSTS